MKIDSLKDLERLIKLFRKTGVYTAKVDGIELHLSSEAPNRRSKALIEDPMENIQVPVPNVQDAIAQAKAEAAKKLQEIQDYIKTPDAMTEDQLLNWSVRPEAGHEQ